MVQVIHPLGSQEKIWKYFFLTCILAILWTLTGAFTGELYSGDETRVAGIAASMYYGGEWIIPKLNGTPFLEYPPLYYQLTSLSYHLFGLNDIAAKLPSALAAFGGILLFFLWAQKLQFSPFYAMISSFMLMSSAPYFSNGRICRVDMLLCFFIIMALYGATCFLHSGGSHKEHLFGWVLLAAGVAGGIMTKGLVGAAIPASGLGIFIILEDILDRKFRIMRYIIIGLAFLAALIPPAVWLWILYLKNGYEAFHEVAVVNGIGRFSGAQGDHVEPVYWYLVRTPEFFQPYLIFVLGGLYYMIRKAWKKQDRKAIYLLCLFLVPYLMLT